MPKADDLNTLLVAFQPVDDAVETANDFAKVWQVEFRHAAANFRKLGQAFGAGDECKSHPDGGIGVVLGDVADNVRQIRLRRRGNDYAGAAAAQPLRSFGRTARAIGADRWKKIPPAAVARIEPDYSKTLLRPRR